MNSKATDSVKGPAMCTCTQADHDRLIAENTRLTAENTRLTAELAAARAVRQDVKPPTFRRAAFSKGFGPPRR